MFSRDGAEKNGQKQNWKLFHLISCTIFLLIFPLLVLEGIYVLMSSMFSPRKWNIKQAILKHCFPARYVVSGAKYCKGLGNHADGPGLTYLENCLTKDLTRKRAWSNCYIFYIVTHSSWTNQMWKYTVFSKGTKCCADAQSRQYSLGLTEQQCHGTQSCQIWECKGSFGGAELLQIPGVLVSPHSLPYNSFFSPE